MPEKAIPPKKAKPSWRVKLLEAAAVLLLLATLLGFAGAWYWLIDLFAHFRVQYALLILPVVALAALARAWRAVVLCAFALALNAIAIGPLYVVPTPTAADDPAIPIFKLVAINVRRKNREFSAVAEYLRREQADLVLIEEVDDAWLAAMQAQLSEYRLEVGQGRDDNFGIALLVRTASEDTGGLQLESAEIVDIANGDAREVDSIVARGTWHGRSFSLLGMHTIPPQASRHAATRDAHLAAAAGWSIDEQSRGNAVIIAGDLNATPWSHAFRRLCREGNLLNSQRGFGVQPTYHRNYAGVRGIPIDHCLHSAGLRTVQRTVDSSDLGSDHRPIAVTLQWLRKESPLRVDAN